MPDYQFVGDTPQAPLGEALWQPREIRTVDAAQAAELRKNANWKEVPPATPQPGPAPIPTVAPVPDVVPAEQQSAEDAPVPDTAAPPEPPAGG